MGDIMSGYERRYERFEYRNWVFCGQCIESNETRKKPLVITIIDISYSGLGFLCNQRLEKDTVLSLNLRYKTETKKLKVKVNWCTFTISNDHNQRFRSGVQFIELTRPDIIFLNSIISNL